LLLKYLDLQGFKSFPDKTRVAFGRGLTGVVGPNGSGKSNISDAVRWVLGEQSTRTLRGEKMEDVIFSGTQQRKSQGFAEVSLTVDNADRSLSVDSDEVTITRRYDRTGESEYKINGATVRLRDVHELLMDTGLGRDGYSLIGQGKIAEIIQSKSAERREIFEEAAGITKYRYRKNESEKSLERAEENLLRLRDILSELSSRVEPLREQAEKAKRFLALSEQKKTLEVSIWVDTIEKSNQSLKDQSDKLVVAEERHNAAELEIKRMEEENQQLFARMQQCLIDSDSLRRKKAEAEADVSAAQSQAAVCENDILHNEQDAARIEGELEDCRRSAESAGEELRAREAKAEGLRASMAELREREEEKQRELTAHLSEDEAHTQKERELGDEVNALLLRQSEAKMSVASARMNLSELSQTVADNEKELSAGEEALSACQKELSEAQTLAQTLAEKIGEQKNALEGRKQKLSHRTDRLSELRKENESLTLALKERQQKAKLLEGMEQSLEGYAYAVKEVLRRGRNGALQGVRGAVSQLLETDGEYSVAIETALGGAMQNIVVENEGSAKAAIRLLQAENLGRATFLPLTSVQGSFLREEGLERYAGYMGIASELVRYAPEYAPVVRFLLGRIVVVDDIDTAVLIAKKYGYKFRIVTLDGQVVNAGGSMTGGSHGKSQNFFSRKNEIQALHEEIAALQAEMGKKREALRAAEAEAARMEAELTAAQSEITTLGEDSIRAEGEKKRLSQILERDTERLARMREELSAKREKEADLKRSLTSGQEECERLSQAVSRASEELSALQASNREFAGRRTVISEELSALKIEEMALQKDEEAVRRSIAELKERRNATGEQTARLEQERAALLAESEEIREKIAALQERARASAARAQEMERQSGEALARRQTLEGEATALRGRTKKAQEEKEGIAGEIVRLDERRVQLQKEFDSLIAKLWDEYELTRSEAQRLAKRLPDLAAANRELASLRGQIRGLGSVNVDAIEEYKEVKERYDFLSSQIADAESAKAELLALIGELTEKMQRIFAENFTKINDRFQTIFVELFGGGRAELRLVDPEDILETGIEIAVEPPGKIINNLAALSGGEQAFVAIAIYFAILKVHPAPFCILDEIEAALDDVNVDKYAQYLKSMSDGIQFIAITHRRGTMEAADILYGVTMQDEGVSKLLQLKASEIERLSS